MLPSIEQSVLPQLSQQELDQLRREITRKVVRLLNCRQWPACRLRTCRRQRRCEAPDFACANEVPRREVSPQKAALAMAQFRRMAQRRLAELQGEGTQGAIPTGEVKKQARGHASRRASRSSA
jgi:hypothetical protein